MSLTAEPHPIHGRLFRMICDECGVSSPPVPEALVQISTERRGFVLLGDSSVLCRAHAIQALTEDRFPLDSWLMPDARAYLSKAANREVLSAWTAAGPRHWPNQRSPYAGM